MVIFHVISATSHAEKLHTKLAVGLSGLTLHSFCSYISLISPSKGFKSPVRFKTGFFYTFLFKRLVDLPRMFRRITEVACINSNNDYISFEKILHRQD